jgi:hypothetical protein
MFKQFLLLGLILLFLAGCAGNTTEDGLPILRIDDEHMALDNQPGKPYEIPPGQGFALQLSGYRFRIPESLGVDKVNSIQLITDTDQMYTIPIDTTVTSYKATSETLIPLGESPPFDGLAEGEDITIGIGYTYPDGRFYPSWMGIISVTEEQP